LQDIRADLKPEIDDERAHLDPDLQYNALVDRPSDWRPAFGQSGAAARHLINQEFGSGDLFIFFGWFQRTKVSGGKLKFDPDDSNGRHIIFGWLQVGDVVEKLPLRPDLSFLNSHPHVRFFKAEGGNNRVYVSAETGLRAGVFRTESDGIVLTQEGKSRSTWLLDNAFEPLSLSRELTYHGNASRWGRRGKKILLQVVNRGQEFVFDGDEHPSAKDYFVKRIKLAGQQQVCRHLFDM
jgi:hypothetical protein